MTSRTESLRRPRRSLTGGNPANPLYPGSGQTKRLSGRDGVRVDDEFGRTPFRKDYARLIHAPSFRRLQGKTQLFPGTESDFFRNRLTHSLEVAQIARGIACRLNATTVPDAFPGGWIDEDLVEFAAIAHDLGHPPFGHNGELALDSLMGGFGGFEGNAQTLRILACIEEKLVGDGDDASSGYGLDLTHRALAAVLKYDNCIPIKRDPSKGVIKGYYDSEARIVSAVKREVAPNMSRGKTFKTIECAIMDVADDIAYSTYDLEDSLHAGFVTPLSLANSLTDPLVMKSVVHKTNRVLESFGLSKVANDRELFNVIIDAFWLGETPEATVEVARPPTGTTPFDLPAHLTSRSLDQAFSTDSAFRTRFTAKRIGRLIEAVEFEPDRKTPQLSTVRMRRDELLQVEVLKHLNYEVIIRSPRLAVVEHRGKDIVKRIFEAIVESDGAFLQPEWKRTHAKAMKKSKGHAMRVVCDFVACMTDRYAVEFHARLFGEGASIFKPL